MEFITNSDYKIKRKDEDEYEYDYYILISQKDIVTYVGDYTEYIFHNINTHEEITLNKNNGYDTKNSIDNFDIILQ